MGRSSALSGRAYNGHGFVPRGEAGRYIPEGNAVPGARLSLSTKWRGLVRRVSAPALKCPLTRPAITRRPAAEWLSRRRCRDRSAAWWP
jgi:hypothetical protein